MTTPRRGVMPRPETNVCLTIAVILGIILPDRAIRRGAARKRRAGPRTLGAVGGLLDGRRWLPGPVAASSSCPRGAPSPDRRESDGLLVLRGVGGLAGFAAANSLAFPDPRTFAPVSNRSNALPRRPLDAHAGGHRLLSSTLSRATHAGTIDCSPRPAAAKQPSSRVAAGAGGGRGGAAIVVGIRTRGRTRPCRQSPDLMNQRGSPSRGRPACR